MSRTIRHARSLRPRKAPPIALAANWSWHRRVLLRIREHLLRECTEHTSAVRVSLDRGGEDVVDRANDKCEHDTLLAEIRLEEAELAEVEAALERIAAGTYGICELTGRPISRARLRAIPWTRLSQRAAAQIASRLQR
jgi:RNA polymerase-binding transcription factor DksA